MRVIGTQMDKSFGSGVDRVSWSAAAFDMDLLEHVIDQTYCYCPKWKHAVASVAAVAFFSERFSRKE